MVILVIQLVILSHQNHHVVFLSPFALLLELKRMVD